MATPESPRTPVFHPRLIEAARVYTAVCLTTEEAQRILKRRFEPYQRGAYFLAFTARRCMSPGRVVAVEQSLRDGLEATMSAIKECLDDMEAWVKLHHYEPRPSEPLPPLNTRVGVGTALAMRYLEVIAQLDHALWCLHAVERVDFRKRGHWKKRAHDLTGRVRHLDVEARRKIDALRAGHGFDASGERSAGAAAILREPT